MNRALIAATITMIICYIIYFIVLHFINSNSVDSVIFLSYAIPCIGAAITAYTSPSKKFNNGVFTFYPSVILYGLSQYIATKLGFIDYWEGNKIIFLGAIVESVIIMFLTIIGALIGTFTFNREKSNA